MKTFVYILKPEVEQQPSVDDDVIVIHAANREAADYKLSVEVTEPKKWRLA